MADDIDPWTTVGAHPVAHLRLRSPSGGGFEVVAPLPDAERAAAVALRSMAGGTVERREGWRWAPHAVPSDDALFGRFERSLDQPCQAGMLPEISNAPLRGVAP